MRDENLRINRYKEKMRGSALKLRTEALKKQQEALYRAKAVKQQAIDIEVAGICSGRVPSMMLINYINFAKEIVAKKEKHAGETFCAEVMILRAKHAARGEDTEVLDDIIERYAPACALAPTAHPFRLDVSELDGPDVLS